MACRKPARTGGLRSPFINWEKCGGASVYSLDGAVIGCCSRREIGSDFHQDRIHFMGVEKMSFRRTGRVAIYAAAAWLCLLASAVVVRVTGVEIGGVQPEAVMLTFMMTLPFQLGLIALAVGVTALLDCLSGRGRSGRNPVG